MDHGRVHGWLVVGLGAVATMLVAAFAGGGAAAPQAANAAPCAQAVDPDGFASKRALRRLNARLEDFGARPTGTGNHRRFVSWLERTSDKLPGVSTKSVSYPIRRWDERRIELALDGEKLRVAGPIPYTKPTGRGGVTGPVTFLDNEQELTRQNAAGRIVVKQLDRGSVPYSVFGPGALGVSLYDPDGTIDPSASYERDFLNTVTPHLETAAEVGAKALLVVKDIPRKQLRGFYAPYEGLQWGVPGAYLGAEAGARIEAALADGGADARFTLRASRKRANTRSVIATLKGSGAEPDKLVVESHTDGVSPLWDNGPISMLAIARDLARTPRRCRPRTIQFVFTTGHLYQHLVSKQVRDGSAEQLAAKLDAQYDRGKVAGVMALEHFGAREYEAVPRSDGPGSVLEPTGLPELLLVPTSESDALRDAATRQIEAHDLDRTAVIVGADAPEAGRAPEHCSFGGEGTPYNKHLLPTISAIAAPNTLFNGNRAFGLRAIDFAHMRKQTIAFDDVLREMSRMSRAAIAGDVTEMRAQRAAGAPVCPA